jgi:hypothetical protein
MFAQLPSYSGHDRGSAGVSFLAAFDAYVGVGKWGQSGEALRRKLYAFASCAEVDSVFDLWCLQHVRPLAQQILSATETCVTVADQQAVYNQYKPMFEAVFKLFKDDFCRSDMREYWMLVAELVDVCKSHVGSAVWRPLHHVILKLQQSYCWPLPWGVPAEQDFVAQLLSTDHLPVAVSLKLQAAVDGLAQGQLPPLPADGAAGFKPRLTFVAVLAAVAHLAQQVDQAMVLQLLCQPGTGVIESQHTVVSQQPVASVTSTHVQASDVSAQAATLSASLQHLSAVDRCEVLAQAFPDALCPEHAMLHPLKSCPLVTAAAAMEVVVQCNPW